MPFKHRSVFILAMGVLIGVALSIGQGAFAERDPAASEAVLPLDELRTFVEILNRVKSDYVEPVGDDKLLENSIRGMLDGLDPHSAYLSPEEFREISISTSGQFGGLGIEVQMQDGYLRVVAPIDDTPAEQAGILPGDLIVRIDDEPVKGMTLMDAVKHLRGEPGSEVELTILREDLDEPFQVQLERAVIDVKSVRNRILEPGYGYLRVSHFTTGTGKDLTAAINSLEEKSNRHLKGIVLDLRNNPGGVLNGAVEVADAFLERGDIVSIKTRQGTAQKFSASSGDMLSRKPIVVLVNGGSASASEIVAGALQDQGRAIIMGGRTFGKGSVQTIMPLQNGAALKLTTARYYTPKGRSIQAAGIEPDVTLESVTVSAKESQEPRFKEADLTNRLDNEDAETAPDTSAPPRKQAAPEPDTGPGLASSDYALFEALNLLKGMNVINSQRQQAAPGA